MSKGDINLSISGGSVMFGNISQGNKNKISASISPQNLKEFQKELAALERSQKISNEQIQELYHDIDQLSKRDNEQDLADRLKHLYKKYSWALEPLKKLFSAIIL
jgi:DNA-binding transcriptional MerR regulator